MSKPILCLDFDGVIHSYTSGWQGADVIPDAPVKGAFDFIREAVKFFDIHIYSSRSHQTGGVRAMIDWFDKWGLDEDLFFPTVKPAAFITIDDRAIAFTGKWPTMQELMSFQPWYKR